jgi:hypothetical protein
VIHDRLARGAGSAIRRERGPGEEEEEKVKRACGIIVALLVALALAAPAAAQPAADGWQGWTWSSVVERLAGWAGGVLGVLGASETETDSTAGDEPAAPAEDPLTVATDGPGQETDSWPEVDPNG